MKKCPDCAELVNDDARVCRFCRHEFGKSPVVQKYQPERSNYGFGLTLAAIIAVLVILGSLGGGSSSETASANNEVSDEDRPSSTVAEKEEPENKYADVGKQAAWVGSGQDAIRNQLKDPESAQFRNVHFYSGGGVPVVCGEVNARNGFGGYTGFERFVSAGTVISAIESQVEGGAWPSLGQILRQGAI